MRGRTWAGAAAIAAAAAVGVIGGSAGISAAGAQDVPAISGGWRLNVEASTNPNGTPPRQQERRPREGGGVAGSDAGSISGGRVTSAEGGEMTPQETARFNAAKAFFMQAPPLLGLKAAKDQVVIIYDPQKGPAFQHKTDNKQAEIETPAGHAKMKVKWDKDKLKREIETPETLHVVEEYSLSPDGKQLIVTVKADSSMVRNVQNGDIRRVYERIQ